MQSAEGEYRKRIATLEGDWQREGDSWYKFKTGETISNQDYLALRRDAKDELVASKERADESNLTQLEALGFEAGEPVNYRNEGPQEGDTAFNQATGRRVVLRGGQWVPVQ